MAVKKGGLGRGLDALFADVPVKEPVVKESKTKNRKKSTRIFPA